MLFSARTRALIRRNDRRPTRLYVHMLEATGMDAMERWFVLLAATGLLGFGATVAWVLAD